MCSVMVNTPEIDPTYLTDDLYRRLVANALQTPDAIDMPYLSLQTPNVSTQQSVIHPLSQLYTTRRDSDLLDLSQRASAQSVIISQSPSVTTCPSLSSLSPSIYPFMSVGTRAPTAHSSAYITPVAYSPPDTTPQMFRTPNPDSTAYRGLGTPYGGRKSSASTASATYTPTASASQSMSSSSIESLESIIEYKPETSIQFERRHSVYGLGATSSSSVSAFPTLLPSDSCPPIFCYETTSSIASSTQAASSMGINTLTTSTNMPTYSASYATTSPMETSNTAPQSYPPIVSRSSVVTALDTMQSPGISGVEELDRFLNDRKYLEFRHKNNMASKKFRTTKKNKQKQMDEQIRYYVEDNKKCHELIAKMEKEIEFCKKILFKNFRKSDSPDK